MNSPHSVARQMSSEHLPCGGPCEALTSELKPKQESAVQRAEALPLRPGTLSLGGPAVALLVTLGTSKFNLP